MGIENNYSKLELLCTGTLRNPKAQGSKFCRGRKVKVKVAQPCLTLCDPMDYTVHGILQARILEWVPFPSPGVLPNPGIKSGSPALQADLYQLSLSGKALQGEEGPQNPRELPD